MNQPLNPRPTNVKKNLKAQCKKTEKDKKMIRLIFKQDANVFLN